MSAFVAITTADGRVLCERCRIADSFGTRLLGLMGRRDLGSSDGLLITTNAVHTCFMRFDLDLVFLDVRGVVVRVAESVRPWRAAVCRGAHRVIELPPGTSAGLELEPGHELDLRPTTEMEVAHGIA